jgi:hypothetical protein
MGALGKDPRFALAGDRAGLLAQQQQLEAAIAAKGGKAPKRQARLDQVTQAIGALGTDPGSDMSGFATATVGANTAINGLLGQINGQGTFNPGSFQQSRQAATDSIMSEFNRLNAPRFAQEDQDFRQRLAEEGIDPLSEKGRNMTAEFNNSRQGAIQGAQNSAMQFGQQEQQQAYNQAYNTYGMPTTLLQALNPYYASQAQSGENVLDRNMQLQLSQLGIQGQRDLAKDQFGFNRILQREAPRGGGGGGGLSFDQQMALQNNSLDKNFYNQMVLLGMQQGGAPNPGVAGGLAQGLGAGIGAGIGAGLMR